MSATYRSVFSRQEPWIAPSGGGDLPCQGRSGMQRHRDRQLASQCQPLPHLEDPPRDMGVLHEGKLVALNGKFRQPVHHREDAVMVTWRNGFEKPSPCRLGCRQDKGGRTWIGGDLPFDEIEDRRVASRRDRETSGPWPSPSAQDRIDGTSVSPGGGVGGTLSL